MTSGCGTVCDAMRILSSDELLPTINNAFNKLSDEQWILIENGLLDSDVQAVLADMISEIIQIATAKILILALPAIQRGASTDLEKNPFLGDSISVTFAKALSIPVQHCVSATQLAMMIERESQTLLKKVAENLEHPVILDQHLQKDRPSLQRNAQHPLV